jgi:DNA-directed RNA polymerase specialized sigma24 family protein
VANDRVLQEVPAVHLRALLLRGAGVTDHAIAADLDIPVEAVGPILAVARTKLLSTLRPPDGDDVDRGRA